MTTTVPCLYNDSLARAQKHAVIRLPFAIATGAIVAAVTYVGDRVPQILVEPGIGAGTLTVLTQANIDALLGSSSEVVASTAFGATAMVSGTTLGWVLDCGGQIAAVDAVKAWGTITAGGSATTQLGKGTTTALTNAAVTNPQVYVTASGNLAGRVTMANLVSGTSVGYCVFEINAILK